MYAGAHAHTPFKRSSGEKTFTNTINWRQQFLLFPIHLSFDIITINIITIVIMLNGSDIWNAVVCQTIVIKSNDIA